MVLYCYYSSSCDIMVSILLDLVLFQLSCTDATSMYASLTYPAKSVRLYTKTVSSSLMARFLHFQESLSMTIALVKQIIGSQTRARKV